MKKVFGGPVKKPLMTKVSMRHLNEIVRERNQYSRDAMEAWQDFINLKGRMDTELAKVTKRNNFLVEELESWKAQFLKFQAFAEQLTKETTELKSKIENYRRENRRLTSLSEQNRDEISRLNVRLAGTEKQRDEALEALVLQQEIAEELDRERKRIQRELKSLQSKNGDLNKQKDEAHRVVSHLRALIDGQSHHMDHILKEINKAPELHEIDEAKEAESSSPRTPEAEEAAAKRASMNDVADRYLREKTDSISYIIQNISEQCSRAIADLQLVNRTDSEEVAAPSKPAELTVPESEGDESESVMTQRDSIPPTPDLIHHNRSSTTMSVTTEGTSRDTDSVIQAEAPLQTRIISDELPQVNETSHPESKQPVNSVINGHFTTTTA